MRRILVLSATVFLAACATQPTQVQTQQQRPQSPLANARGHVIGLTAEELVQRFGAPALQIREGNSWKLQFRSGLCVLDAYLYPQLSGQTPYRVTYVETRTPSLGSIRQMDCISSFPQP
jgi:starvation-inducible outer membrane lipoprotein